MAKRIVALIGNGIGPTIHTEGNCHAVVEGLRQGGVVTVSIDSGEQFVTEENGAIPLGKPRRVSVEARHACRELVCKILMEA